MKKALPAESPDAYVAALTGWQRSCVEQLRSSVRGHRKLEERIKWGNLVYFSDGPLCMIRAEAERVLFGFWRGKRLREIEPRLKPGGKYEMATLVLLAKDNLDPASVRKLCREAIRLNSSLGDLTQVDR